MSVQVKCNDSIIHTIALMEVAKRQTATLVSNYYPPQHCNYFTHRQESIVILGLTNQDDGVIVSVLERTCSIESSNLCGIVSGYKFGLSVRGKS